MSQHLIAVSSAELDVIRLAIGRMVKPEPAAPKRAARKPAAPKLGNGKPRGLSDQQRHSVESRWERAIAEPKAWHVNLAGRLAKPMGYRDADAVAAAWGLPPVRQRLIDARAARS